MVRGREPLGRCLRVFRFPLANGVRWALGITTALLLVHGLASWLSGDDPLEAQLVGLAQGFAWAWAVMFVVWLLIRRLSTVAVHEDGIMVGSTLGTRAVIPWHQIDRPQKVSAEGFHSIEIHRAKRLNGFISVEVFADPEFRRLVTAAGGSRVAALFDAVGLP